MKRLDLLKADLAYVKGLRTLSFDIKNDAIAYYEREIHAIEEYDANNPALDIRGNEITLASCLIGETIWSIWANQAVAKPQSEIVDSVSIETEDDTITCSLKMDNELICELSWLNTWIKTENGNEFFCSTDRDAVIQAYMLKNRKY